MNEHDAIKAAEHAGEIARFQREQTRRERIRQMAEQDQPAGPGVDGGGRVDDQGVQLGQGHTERRRRS